MPSLRGRTHRVGGICELAVTIKDIARQCGVSRQSVSYALTGTGRLAPQTRERILQVARDLGYRPNSIARTMRTGRFGAATLLLAAEPGGSFLPAPLLNGIHDGLQAHDMHLTIARMSEAQLVRPDHAPKLLREWASDGLLVNFSGEVSSGLKTLIDRYSIPHICLNTRREQDCIAPGEAEAAEDATLRLIELGHRRIAMAVYREPGDGGNPQADMHDRWHGYDKVMTDAGLESVTHEGDGPVEADRAVAHTVDWLRGRDRPTAVLAYSHKEMIAVMRAAGLAQLRVPQDLSVVAFSWAGMERLTLGVTHVLLPEYEMGKQAVDMLTAKLDRPDQPLPRRIVPCTWRDGQTVAPPPPGHGRARPAEPPTGPKPRAQAPPERGMMGP